MVKIYTVTYRSTNRELVNTLGYIHVAEYYTATKKALRKTIRNVSEHPQCHNELKIAQNKNTIFTKERQETDCKEYYLTILVTSG